MRAADEPPSESRDEPAAQPPDTAESMRPGMKPTDRASVRRARRAAEWGKNKYAGSSAEYLWHRLDAADFMNQAMILAATLLLCAVPFLLVATALAGRSVVTGLTLRLGMNQQAAADMGHLFTSSSATSNDVTGLSWAFFILAGIAAASAVQLLYQRVFGLPPQGLRDKLRAVIWLAVVVGWIALGSAVAPRFYASAPVLWWLVNIPAFIGLWWFTIWFLLGGRVPWRQLLPCAAATGAFWIGMLTVFHLIFSSMVISYDQKYGADRDHLRPHVVLHRDRGGAHPGRGRGPDVAGPWHVLASRRPETAADRYLTELVRSGCRGTAGNPAAYGVAPGYSSLAGLFTRGTSGCAGAAPSGPADRRSAGWRDRLTRRRV
jgi:membrane protein